MLNARLGCPVEEWQLHALSEIRMGATESSKLHHMAGHRDPVHDSGRAKVSQFHTACRETRTGTPHLAHDQLSHAYRGSDSLIDERLASG